MPTVLREDVGAGAADGADAGICASAEGAVAEAGAGAGAGVFSACTAIAALISC